MVERKIYTHIVLMEDSFLKIYTDVCLCIIIPVNVFITYLQLFHSKMVVTKTCKKSIAKKLLSHLSFSVTSCYIEKSPLLFSVGRYSHVDLRILAYGFKEQYSII